MAEFASFFVILSAGLILSEIFRRLHLPWVAALIVTGMILGPFGFDFLELNGSIEFIGQVGLIFLMFMAGLETKVSSFREYRRGVETLTLLNGIIPFLVGLSIARFFGYEWVSALLLGIVFISSSIAIVIPTLDSNKLLDTKLGKIIVGGTMIQDISSLVMLSVLLQVTNPITRIPLPLFYLLFMISLFVLRWLIPRIKKQILSRLFGLVRKNKQEIFQQELRLVIAMLIGIVLLFELLGLHPIIAGFFAGLVLSDSITSERLLDKLHVISYGIFVPTFFVVIGAGTDLGVIRQSGVALLLSLLVLVGSMGSKFLSGLVSGRLMGFSWKQGVVMGISTTPQLTTTLAVVFSAFEFGYFDERLVTAMVLLTLVTTLFTPLLINAFVERYGVKAMVAAQQETKS